VGTDRHVKKLNPASGYPARTQAMAGGAMFMDLQWFLANK